MDGEILLEDRMSLWVVGGIDKGLDKCSSFSM